MPLSPDKLLVDHLKELQGHPGWQMVAERRRLMLTRTRSELQQTRTWEDARFLQGRASVLEIDEIQTLIDELNKKAS